MKTNIFPAIKLTIILVLFFSVVYPLLIWGIAQAAPNKGEGKLAEYNGKVVGYANIGQSFSQPGYFWGRPSAVDYNAAGSCGSNKGPSNPDYLATVQARIDTFLVYHPYLKVQDIPAEMVTASGSGLDPDISPAGALIQVERVAKVRNITADKLVNLITEVTVHPVLGPEKINVLQLNIALDNIK